MTTNRIKILVIAVFVFLIITVVSFKANEIGAALNSDDDAATLYKTKCAACHTPKADKYFDVSKTDEAFVETILKGKKGEKPPAMPAFETKGITPEQAKALAAYMRKLRAPVAANVNTTANTNANANVVVNANANANVKPNANANAPVNTNANANTSANTSANANANANTNANVKTNSNLTANVNSTANVNKVSDEETATAYKTKCASCHSPKAEKFFDPAIATATQVDVILKGKKGAKPPYMPGYEAKGMTAAQAAALVEYMRSLRASGK